MNASKNTQLRSNQKYHAVHASAGFAKRNIHLAIGRPAFDDSKDFDRVSLRLVGKFGGEIVDMPLPEMRAADFLRGV